MPREPQDGQRVVMGRDDMTDATLDSRCTEFVCPVGVNDIAPRLLHGSSQRSPLLAEEVEHLPPRPALRAYISLNAMPCEKLRLAHLCGKPKDDDFMASLMQFFNKRRYEREAPGCRKLCAWWE